MKVTDIKDQKFLKKLKEKDLIKLSSDIREFLVDGVSKTGGHLSPNLGVVELTIALHKVFDTPKDKIIFDVSHQAYVHKILTGRASKFDTLRQKNGLSGFQKRSESEYDAYEAGHSSTSLSAALGMALARDMNGGKYNVIAVIGDGSIQNGLCYEALNQIGSTQSKVIIILNDNDMSISKATGAFHNHLDRLRISKGYEGTKTKTKNILYKVPYIGNHLVSGVHKIKHFIKKAYTKEGFLFEELGIDYLGPINGHDFKKLEKYLKKAKEATEPVLIHVITEKGKGYKYAQEDTTGKWHGIGPFNKETGETIKANDGKITWSEVVSNSLDRLFNDDLVVITPAMETGSKLTNFKNNHPKNFIDVGMAEEHALVLANAMSLEGKVPFVSIYSSFLQRGYDEIVHDIARMNSHVILGIDRAGIVGADGETHQGLFDVTFLLPIPNMIVSAPKDSIEAANLIKTAIDTPSPFAIRYSRNSLDYFKTDIKKLKIGSWETIVKGEDATLITYGDFVNESISLISKFQKQGINIELVNARFLKPIDKECFKRICSKNKPIFVYEESMEIGSLGSYLKTLTNKDITIFGVKDEFVLQGKRSELLEELELDIPSIYVKIKEVLDNARVRK